MSTPDFIHMKAVLVCILVQKGLLPCCRERQAYNILYKEQEM